MQKQRWISPGTAYILGAGAILAAVALLLTRLGNPANMGLCVACFLRDTAGGLGLHQALPVQYIRPEILGIGLGALAAAMLGREFSPRAGSAPAVRFLLGFFLMIGALMFLGCPLRMMLRLGGGDLNALVGLAGFVAGILGGILCLNQGFSLGRAYPAKRVEGFVFPGLLVGLWILLMAFPFLLHFSKEGPGSLHAPLIVSLICGLAVGAVAQKTRYCTVAGIRDAILFRECSMLLGFLVLILVTAAGNLLLHTFHLGFENQPIAHTDGLWNFLGMALVGITSVLLGGCPLRQLILSGEGSGDSAISVIGMLAGAAFCHNFGLASSGEGPTAYGQIGVCCALLITLVIACVNIYTNKKKGAA